MHFFLPYLLNDSQTIRSTIHFSKPLVCVTLFCGDWSFNLKQCLWAFNAPKAAPSGKEWIYIYACSRRFYPKRLTVHSGYNFFCLYVCSLGIEPTTFCAAMLYHWATGTLFACLFRPTRKSSFPRSGAQQVGGQYANASCWRQNENGIHFKNDSFQWFRVDSFFWETITLYTVHFQI